MYYQLKAWNDNNSDNSVVQHNIIPSFESLNKIHSLSKQNSKPFKLVYCYKFYNGAFIILRQCIWDDEKESDNQAVGMELKAPCKTKWKI